MAQIATQNNTYSHADAHPTGRVPFSRYAGPLDKLVSIKVERRSEEIKLFDRFGNRKEKKLNPPFSPLSFFASFAPCGAHRGRNLYRMNENLCVCVWGLANRSVTKFQAGFISSYHVKYLGNFGNVEENLRKVCRSNRSFRQRDPLLVDFLRFFRSSSARVASFLGMTD